VHAGYADILQPDLALVSTAHLDGVLIFGTNDVETSLLPALLALIDALEDDVGQFGLLDGDHLHGEVALLPSDHAREGLLADLALELGEVVRHHHARHLLLHLAVDPHLQAQHVHALAGTLALAGRDQEVVRSAVVTEAKLAAAAYVLIGFVDAVELSQEELAFFFSFALIAADLNHSILHTSQLHDIS
jgi:hypothetical protein